jgi:hypothetical protein
MFISWLKKELGVEINLAGLDEMTFSPESTPVLRTKAALRNR